MAQSRPGYEPVEPLEAPPAAVTRARNWATAETTEVVAEPVEVPVADVPVAEVPAEAPVADAPVVPARRRPLAPRSKVVSEPEPEWTAAEQALDEEVPPDRIPDAMDVLALPPAGVGKRAPMATLGSAPTTAPLPAVATSSSGATLAGSAPPPPPSTAEPQADRPVPPPWTPPTQSSPKVDSGGARLSVVAIVVSLIVPIVGAVVGFVLALRARRRALPLARLAQIVAVVALVAWLVVGAVVVAAGKEGADYSTLKVGDCFNSSATNEVRGINVLSCAQSHNSEVFFLVTHPAGPADPYPGKDALVQFAADGCLGQPLTTYLGAPLERSKFKDFEIVPQESAWKDGRRVLVCGIDTGGQGRVKGSAMSSLPAG